MLMPAPPSLRPNPYVEANTIAFLYDGVGKFLKIKILRLEGSMIEYKRCTGRKEIGYTQPNWPYLSSEKDFDWFRKVVLKHGVNKSALFNVAERDHEVAYLLCWLAAIDATILLQQAHGATLPLLKPKDYLQAIRTVKV